MDHYSHADRTAMTRAVRRLLEHCDCYGRSAVRSIDDDSISTECCPGSNTRRIRLGGETTYCAFEPGSGVEVGPDGRASYYSASPQARTAVSLRGMSQVSIGRLADGRDRDPPEAPLPTAFRVHRLLAGRRPDVEFAVPTKEAGGARTETVPVGKVPVGTTRSSRTAFVGTLPSYPEDLERSVAHYEDSMCLERLRRLDAVDEEYTCRHDSTLGELARFVAGLNASRPRELRLDRVLVNYGMFLVLFRNDRRTPGWAAGYPFYDGSLLYGNMSVLDGIAFLEHPEIPHGSAYALSSRQGPVFAHGPSSVHCTEDALEANRECKVIDPPEGATGCPWGVKFGADIGYDLEETRFSYDE
ncbi:MAG: hypothetical protein OXU25_06765 [Thaumarchaeota archaeon]|nr:hypothetical protein [Nitrososphaerota archaeon]